MGMSAEIRLSRLQQSIHAASWWLMGQGLLLALMGSRISNLLHLRYHPNMAPYIQLAGFSLLMLGFFTYRTVREASKQYVAVDTLTLFFLGLVISRFSYRVMGNPLTWLEWLSLVADLGFGATLVIFRTKGSQMEDKDALVARDALELAKAAVQKMPLPVVKVELPVESPSPETSAPIVAEAEPEPTAAPSKPKARSEAMPHMD